jgi:hypothetical protein
MSKEEFKIVYRGADVSDGTMNVRELAPSLLALGEAFEEINKLVNQKESTIKINVKAVHSGSFGVSLEIITSLPAQISSLFGSVTLQDAETIFKIFFGSAGLVGLIDLIRRAKNRNPDKATVVETDTVRLEFSGSDNKVDQIIVNKNVYNTFINIPIRRSVEQFVHPLQRGGIDEIEAIKSSQKIEKITKKDSRYFQAPVLDEQKLQEYESIMVLSIVMLSFKGDSWRMSDGQNAFWVTILDTDFLNQVDANRAAFTKGDKLRMRVRVTQWQTPENELKTEYQALEVIEHIQGALQLQLQLKDETRSSSKPTKKSRSTKQVKAGRKDKSR